MKFSRTTLAVTFVFLSMAAAALADPATQWQEILNQPTPELVKSPMLLKDIGAYALKFKFNERGYLRSLLLRDRLWISGGSFHGIEGIATAAASPNKNQVSRYYAAIPGSCSFVISDDLRDILKQEDLEPSKGIGDLLDNNTITLTIEPQGDGKSILFASEKNVLGDESNQAIRFDSNGAVDFEFVRKLTPRSLVLLSKDGNLTLTCIKNSIEPFSIYNLQAIFGNRAVVQVESVESN